MIEKKMASLGNIECYFFLSDRSHEYYKGLDNALRMNPSDTLRNVWDKEIIGEKIVFDEALFVKPLEPKEVIYVLQYIDDNLVTYILLNRKIIVRISFKPWIDLSSRLKDFIVYLLGHYTYLLIGFELDFDTEAISYNDLLASLKRLSSNSSFMLKEYDAEIKEYISKWDIKGTLEFLKKKTEMLLIE